MQQNAKKKLTFTRVCKRPVAALRSFEFGIFESQFSNTILLGIFTVLFTGSCDFCCGTGWLKRQMFRIFLRMRANGGNSGRYVIRYRRRLRPHAARHWENGVRMKRGHRSYSPALPPSVAVLLIFHECC